MRWIQLFACICAFVVGLSAAGAAFADHVIVQRNVTVREGPSRRTEVITFAPVGASLNLLDGGARRSGYYHVVLPDGRRGWIYYTFVRRAPGDAPASEGLAALAGDRVAVHYINVEQGAAALVEFPCAAIMIDAGGRTEADTAHLVQYLDAFFARRPDLGRTLAAVFISHTHTDHNFSLRAVAQRYRVERYIHNGVLNGSGRNVARWMVGYPPNIPSFAATSAPPIEVRAVSQQNVSDAGGDGLTDAVIDPVACPRVDPRIRVLAAPYDQNPGWTDEAFEDGNNKSLVVRIDYDQAAFLFTGDMEEAALETLVETYPTAGGALDVDVYHVGHHGSYNGTTASLLRAMTPEVAVISMGPMQTQARWTAWQYGHPRRPVVELLDRHVTGRRPTVTPKVADAVKRFSDYRLEKAIYATGWDGDIVIESGADGVLRVRTGQ